mgnify:CR=1 FL=1
MGDLKGPAEKGIHTDEGLHKKYVAARHIQLAIQLTLFCVAGETSSKTACRSDRVCSKRACSS